MAIFTRRRLQLMLDEVAPKLKRGSDLLTRLESKDPDQALPAEYELAIGWALSKVTDLEIEPSVGGKSPDFLVDGLFPGRKAIVEVAALSDDALSGESLMERTANIVGGYSDSVRKGASQHMYFRFQDVHGYRPVQRKGETWPRSAFFRTRLASKDFRLTDEHKAQLREWLRATPPTVPLRLLAEGTDVLISWQDRVHPRLRVFSSMPSLTHSLTENPLYRRLKEKERKQLKIAGPDFMRCIFLGDAGCRLLRVPVERDATRRVISGSDIIRHFLANSSVDLVAVFSPRRHRENSSDTWNNPRLWHIDLYGKEENAPPTLQENFNRIGELLPRPRLHGYQARSWLQQGMLDPQGRGQYNQLIYGGGREHMTARVSTRAILEMLAGRMSAEDFRNWVSGKDNIFENWLARGYAISNVKFEASGPDEDDDCVVIELTKDPNASPLELRTATASKEPADKGGA